MRHVHLLLLYTVRFCFVPGQAVLAKSLNRTTEARSKQVKDS